MRVKIILTINLFALAFLFARCTKTGPTGPAGTNGATGATGNTGANGATDIQSYTGVIASLNWKKVNNSTEWNDTVSVIYNATTNTGIGSSVMNAGTVQVFVIPPDMVKPNVNMHDYIEVQKAYNL